MTNLLNWFDKGMTGFEYIQAMNVHKERLLTVYNGVHLKDEEKKRLQQYQTKGLKAIVLTADWCGDAMVNVPILIRLANEALIETRYLIRDEHLELMDQYLTNGKSRSIPIVIFLDENGEEVAKWGPRAPEVQTLVEKLKAEQNIPEDKEDPKYEEAFKAFVQSMSKEFSGNEQIWNEVKTSLMETIEKAI
ncbi:thioredoxin [Alkalihalobacillus alcalophilus ATCC 27647 = CGMCC 1.3604]|uniref:Thioredoxin n=1 Tax=Alkalihalobacillus alcalophilus ATCC 27647 = CGMCC 1.3604 TaxID=1218173 RepID=A0A094YR30_ALKAL|nr:thioredoxin family protein [Alkalihalobacillus alcalophilus]KGA95927.1 thioredoxin [Alkalihalobacillus alcalophilus ATCC 27647 = CGMCC 1.3604]MED1564048.1 thioredoxin family protein [Alkalihalobacillus alcalophilus]THG91086.1 thioredoxin [Alkalihalobacillus alcalophilus ATCC 27647 = CGMCC 1.3604]